MQCGYGSSGPTPILFYNSVMEPEPQGATSFWQRWSCNAMRLRLWVKILMWLWQLRVKILMRLRRLWLQSYCIARFHHGASAYWRPKCLKLAIPPPPQHPAGRTCNQYCGGISFPCGSGFYTKILKHFKVKLRFERFFSDCDLKWYKFCSFLKIFPC
jgi:hypothetical protein